MYKMNDQQTANLLREIIGSRGSLAAASNNLLILVPFKNYITF